MIALILACAGETTPPEPAVEEAPPVVEVPAVIPNITIDAPAEGTAVVPGTLTASGTAIAWEAALTVQLKASDELLDEQHVNASAAAPARGDWSVDLTVPEGQSGGPWTVSAFTRSAKDGSIQDLATVTLDGP